MEYFSSNLFLLPFHNKWWSSERGPNLCCPSNLCVYVIVLAYRSTQTEISPPGAPRYQTNAFHGNCLCEIRKGGLDNYVYLEASLMRKQRQGHGNGCSPESS